MQENSITVSFYRPYFVVWMKCLYVTTQYQGGRFLGNEIKHAECRRLMEKSTEPRMSDSKILSEKFLCQVMFSEDSHLQGCEFHSRYEHQVSHKPTCSGRGIYWKVSVNSKISNFMKIHSPFQTCHFQWYTLTAKLMHVYFQQFTVNMIKKNKLVLSKFIDFYIHA